MCIRDRKRILGICLGFQQILFCEGAKIVQQKQIYHGFQSEIKVVSKSSIFKYNQVENKKLLVEITLMKLCKVNQSNQINDKTVEKKKHD